MKIYNSMTRKKEELIPLEEGKIKMYACGITVYDLSHIGHARQAIVYSMISEYLRYRGYDVKYVRNYTDVDDKIINRANLLGKDALEFSREQILETEEDMRSLHVKDADINTKASDYIEKIISFIEVLIKKGFAYPTKSGNVYYIVRNFKKYGKLSNKKINKHLNVEKKDIKKKKKDPLDFALWKSAKPGEIYWESPWGKGRPGWHIECSVMALNELGDMIDIHGGGKDLIFPHHENEIAQSEAYTGKPFAKYWSHCGLIRINGEKMSKSLGNSLTIRDALKKYNYEVIKYMFLQKHYTTDIDVKDEDFDVAEKHLYYFYNTLNDANKFILKYYNSEVQNILDDDISSQIKEKFISAMDDDFNTTIALSELFNIFKYINLKIKNSNKSNRGIVAKTLKNIVSNTIELYNIVGLFTQEPIEFINMLKNKYINALDISGDEINKLIKKRIEAKNNKDYEKADKIRNELLEKGIILNDTKEGTIWDIKKLYNLD